MPPRLPGVGAHHSANPQTDEWLTPRYIIDALGPFDLDPCTPVDMPWETAARRYTPADDGLLLPWEGRVWLNPPYSQNREWFARMAEHGDGIALTFARTETSWWFDSVWPYARAVLFLRGRLTFHRPDGAKSKEGHNSGGPSALIAYGQRNAWALADAVTIGALRGALVHTERVT